MFKLHSICWNLDNKIFLGKSYFCVESLSEMSSPLEGKGEIYLKYCILLVFTGSARVDPVNMLPYLESYQIPAAWYIMGPIIGHLLELVCCLRNREEYTGLTLHWKRWNASPYFVNINRETNIEGLKLYRNGTHRVLVLSPILQSFFIANMVWVAGH